MDIQKINQYKSAFDAIAKSINDGENSVEVWYARELQSVLGYARWENFIVAINRAIESCKVQNINVDDHFRELTRYACYLIAQNGDPKKEEIAFAQSYFALQTRKAELIEERLQIISRIDTREKLRSSEKQLSQNIYQRGVDEKGFGRIRSKGDTALFGGVNTEQMKQRLGVKNGALADHLPTLTIAAKNLATEMTNYNVEQKDLTGENPITDEHVKNNQSVREMLTKRNIYPEELPAAEDIRKVERRVNKEEKLLEKNTKLPKDHD